LTRKIFSSAFEQLNLSGPAAHKKGGSMKKISGGNGNQSPELQDPGGFNLKFFVFNGHEVTILVHDDGSIWFIAKECCDALEYVNSRDATKRHCKHSIKAGVAKRDAIGRLQNYTIIPESDLYRLITNAKTPRAEPFKDWLYEEVLPSIRKTGQYSVNPGAADLSNFKRAINDPAKLQEMVAIVLQEVQAKNKIIAAQAKAIQTIQPKALALDRLCASENTVTLNEGAKVLSCAPQAFNRRLGELNWMYKNAHGGRWIPYRRIIKQGLMELKLVPIYRSSGRVQLVPQTLLTPKGLARISMMIGRRAIERVDKQLIST
jgi:anti-repressor protein